MKATSYLYQDLSGQLIGFAFDIFKQIGPRLPEKIYQKAFENKLLDAGIKYQKECYCRVDVDGRRVGSFRLDFLIDDKIVIEFKVRDYLSDTDIAQVLTYLKVKSIRLGLLVLITTSKVTIKRVIL